MLVMLPVASLKKRQARFGNPSPAVFLENNVFDRRLIPTWWWWIED